MLARIAPCFFAIVIDALGFGLVYPVMAAIFSSSHSSAVSADLTTATRHFYLSLSFLLYPLFMFFGASYMGDLSDSLGRKKVLCLCMLGICLSFALMAIGVSENIILLLFAGRALSGLMAGSQPIAQASIADLSTPETLAINMSLISLSYSFGVVIGPLVGGLLSDQALLPWFTFATLFFLSSLLAFIAFLWVLLGFQETSIVKKETTFSLLRPLQIFIELFKHKQVSLLALIFFLMQAGFSIYFQFIIIHMHEVYHYQNWEMGLFQGMLGIGFAIGLLLGMPFALKFLSVRNIAIIGLFLTGFTQILAGIIDNDSAEWVLAILISTFNIMTFSSLLTLFSNAVDKNAQGWVMGITGSVMALAWVLTGLSANLLNLFTTAGLIVMGACALMIAALMLYFYRDQFA